MPPFFFFLRRRRFFFSPSLCGQRWPPSFVRKTILTPLPCQKINRMILPPLSPSFSLGAGNSRRGLRLFSLVLEEGEASPPLLERLSLEFAACPGPLFFTKFLQARKESTSPFFPSRRHEISPTRKVVVYSPSSLFSAGGVT